jgi:hypothetical protein
VVNIAWPLQEVPNNMIPLKPIVIFMLIYGILTAGSLFINQQFSIHPEISLNIVAMILSALAVRKLIKVKSGLSTDLLYISLLGGMCAVISILLFSYYDTGFKPASLLECGVSFAFNFAVVYLTIYVTLVKKKAA